MNLLDIIFPKKCLECGKGGGYICQNCITKMRFVIQRDNLNYSIFPYEGVIRRAIIALKYKFAYDIADELVNICVRSLYIHKSSILNLKSVLLIPIPLHKTRQNWRGFNQSEIIAKKLAQKMNWEYIPDLLIRTKNTKPQVGLKGSVRHSNLSDVFRFNFIHKSIIFNHKSLVLFDDVFTTGSTINEARKTLKESGFKKVYSLSIARNLSKHF